MTDGKNGKFRIPKLRELPVFWRTLLMMLCIVLMAVLAVTVSSRISKKALTDSFLSQAQANLDHYCSEMTTALYNTSAIPQAVEETTYYSYIRTLTSGTLPEKFFSILPSIRRALQNQLYLQGTNEECVLYFPGAGCICTRFKAFPQAEDCFRDYIRFADIGEEDVFGLLRKRGSLTLLPMQEVAIGESESVRRMAFMIHPAGSTISIMTLYSEETILHYLGVDDLPEGTYLHVESKSGEALEDWPGEIGEKEKEACYELHASTGLLRANVTLWIPKSYFSRQLRGSNFAGLAIAVLTAALGLALCVALARASSQPIRALARANRDGSGRTQELNEVQYLAGILDRSKQEKATLQGMLLSNILSRGFSGAVLTEEEERQLGRNLGSVAPPYRLAIVYAGPEFNQILVTGILRGELGETFRCESVNTTESGLLFPDGEAGLRRLETGLEKAGAKLCGGPGLLCGVSAPFGELRDMHVAVRQAHLAIPQKTGLGVFSGEANQKSAFSWLRHERLYQTVLSGDEEGAVGILASIAAEPTRGSAAREAFYNIGFVLRSAADELGVPFGEAAELEYDASLLQGENIRRLEAFVRLLFDRMREKQEQGQNGLQARLLTYLEENYADDSLCTASVATRFGISEKSVYVLVRKASGMSVSEYLLSLRMRQAGALLCTTRQSVGEIAQHCGYQAESTFYRVFKKYYGITPNRYRADGGAKVRQ